MQYEVCIQDMEINPLQIRQRNHVFYFACWKYYHNVKIMLNVRFLSNYQTSTRYEQKMNIMTNVEKLQYQFGSETQAERYT